MRRQPGLNCFRLRLTNMLNSQRCREIACYLRRHTGSIIGNITQDCLKMAKDLEDFADYLDGTVGVDCEKALR